MVDKRDVGGERRWMGELEEGLGGGRGRGGEGGCRNERSSMMKDLNQLPERRKWSLPKFIFKIH